MFGSGFNSGAGGADWATPLGLGWITGLGVVLLLTSGWRVELVGLGVTGVVLMGTSGLDLRGGRTGEFSSDGLGPGRGGAKG